MSHSLLALVLTLAAHHQHTPSAWFLAANPHVPLATIVDGKVHEAVPPSARGHRCGSAARWGKIGSRWTALDAWGQPLGTRVVSAKDDYDVTGCSELSFKPQTSTDLTTVLVAADSSWQSPPSAEWTPTRAESVSFDALVAKQIPDATILAKNVPAECTAIAARARFFDVPGRGHFAVGTSNAGYLLARHDTSGWSVLVRHRSAISTFDTLCYRPVAVFDMNGDGTPEIIMRESESTSWGEMIFELTPSGWRDTVGSPGGSTA